MKKMILTLMLGISLVVSAFGMNNMKTIVVDEGVSAMFNFVEKEYVAQHNAKCNSLINRVKQEINNNNNGNAWALVHSDSYKPLFAPNTPKFLSLFQGVIDPYKELFKHACMINKISFVNQMIDMNPASAKATIGFDLALLVANRGHVKVLETLFKRLNAYDIIRNEQLSQSDKNSCPIDELKAAAMLSKNSTEQNKQAVIDFLAPYLRQEIWDNVKPMLVRAGAIGGLGLGVVTWVAGNFEGSFLQIGILAMAGLVSAAACYIATTDK